MGAPSRFRLFASLIADRFSADAFVADVASGNGQLQAELRQRGFRDVVSWDRRHRNARNRRGYIYGHFDHRSAARTYDLVVGMHPDGATDQIVAYARKHAKPFAICPCCIVPTAGRFEGVGFADWLTHLRELAGPRFRIETVTLPMTGRNIVLIGEPA